MYKSRYEEIINVIKDKVDEKLFDAFKTKTKITFIRARAGAGKTYLSVAYALYKAIEGKRIAIFVRTRSEINQVLRIASDIRSKLGVRSSEVPTITPITSKETLCRFPPKNNVIIKWWCRIIDCEFLNNKINDNYREFVLTTQLSSIREYFIRARDMHLCPYFALQSMASESSVVVTTHPYLIYNELFERLGERDVLIIDEAHNLLKPVTARISERDLNNQVVNLNNDNVQNTIINLWRNNRKGEAMKISRSLNFINSPGKLIRISNEYIKVFPPDELIGERARRSEKIIIVSSTLYPINLYRKLFAGKIDAEIKIIPGFLENTEKRIHVVLKIGLTSRYEERSEKTYRLYARVIINIVNELKKTTIVFVPSREFAKKLSRELRWDIVLDEIDLYQVKTEHVISVMGSRISEGLDININGKEPELLIIAGLPYPRRDREYLEVIKLYRTHYNLDARTLLEVIEMSEMLSRLIQTAGRVGRRKKGAVIIIDDRITKIPLKILTYTSLRKLINELKSFFNVKK